MSNIVAAAYEHWDEIERAKSQTPSINITDDVEKIEDAARDYVLHQREDMLHGNGVPTPEMREYLTFSYKEMTDAFLAGARWHAMTLQQNMMRKNPAAL